MDKGLESVINEHKTQLDAYQKCVDSQQKALDDMASELKEAEEKNADKSKRMRKKIEDLQHTQESLISEQKKKLDDFQKSFDTQIKELNHEFEKAEKKKAKKREFLQMKIGDLLNSQTNMEKDCRQNLKKSFEKVQEKFQEQLQACHKDKDEMKTKISQLETIKEDLENAKACYNVIIDDLKANQAPQTQKWKTKPVSGLIQVLNQNNGNLSTEVERDLVDRLKKLKTVKQVKLCRRPNDVSTELPLLIVCIVLSRPGADALVALKDVPASCMTILAMCHHKDSHLPIPSSVNSLNGPEFQTLQGIYDFAFFSGKGIYNCQNNTESMKKMLEFISKYMQ